MKEAHLLYKCSNKVVRDCILVSDVFLVTKKQMLLILSLQS